MRILLVEPPISSKMVGYTQLVRPEPLALECIAGALLQDGHEVSLLDMRVDSRSLEDVFEHFGPDMVGGTGYTTDVPEMRRILKAVKKLDPSVKTVIGGYHASLSSWDFNCEDVDFIVVGEGEETAAELVKAVEKGWDVRKVPGLILRVDGMQVPTATRKRQKVLDLLPKPARSLSDPYRGNYHFHFWENPYVVETQRGCSHRCSFCSVWVFHDHAVRYHTPEHVVEELKELDGKTEMIIFADDEFFLNPKRAERIARLIKAEGLKFKYWAQVRSDDVVRWPKLFELWRDVGAEALLIGLEKITDEGLKEVNKRTTVETNEKAIRFLQEELGIDIWGAFIVDPSWSRSDFDSLIDYVKSRKIAFPNFTVLTPLPGTQLFKEKFQEIVNRRYEVFDLLHAVLPTKLPLEEFYDNMARLYASTTLGWRDVVQRIKSGRIPQSSLRRVRDLLRDVTDAQAYLRSGQEPELA